MKEWIVIAGFAGIWKTTLAKKYSNVMDVESTPYKYDYSDLEKYDTEKVKWNEDLEENIKKLTTGLLDDSKPKWELYQALKAISEQWLLNDFLEWWIAYCSEKWDYEQAERRIQMKKYLQSNVNQDSVLLYGLMK